MYHSYVLGEVLHFRERQQCKSYKAKYTRNALSIKNRNFAYHVLMKDVNRFLILQSTLQYLRRILRLAHQINKPQENKI